LDNRRKGKKVKRSEMGKKETVKLRKKTKVGRSKKSKSN